MKNFKKFLTLVLAVMMVVSSVAFSTSAATTKFEDIDAKNEELVKAVDLLSYMGVAKGTSETTFGADELVTRQQFALFIYRLMKGGKDAPAGAANSTKFTDLVDPTYNYAIAWANAEGIVNGKSETTFGPKDPIKLQEAYAMIVRALDWEEENDLVYPFGHIEIAEQAGVELDNGLDSSVEYADELTRADMAILLYNAFFAETGIEEVELKQMEIGDKANDNTTWVLYEETTRPRLCEKTFDVIEVVYKAIGTPNYKFGDGEVTYDLGYDAVYFQEIYEDVNDNTAAPDYTYVAAEDMGLEASELNDTFLGEFTMFVTLDEDKDIEKILFADCNMAKKTVTDIKLGEVSSNKVDSYFKVDEEYTDAKLLSGKLIADGEEMYVFNAPYSYASKPYGNAKEEEDRYLVKNSENLKYISFTMTEEDDVPVYTATESSILGEVADEYDAEGLYAAQADALLKAFTQAYYGGYYEADLYDVEGDGLYDYINYKPYFIFQVDTDEDEYFEDYESFKDGDIKGIPYVYVNGATLLGEEFANEDYVIGYYSTELDVVKVAAVLEPTVAAVKSARNGVVTLTNGEKADAVSAWSKLANAELLKKYSYDEDAEEYADYEGIVYDAELQNKYQAANSPLFTTAYIGGDETEFYIYDGVVLFYGDVNANVKFTENLIIPTTLGGKKPVKEAPFNPEADDEVYYVYAWVDGTTKYVQVEYNDDIRPFVFDDELDLDPAYADQLCTYTVSNGIYEITPLATEVEEYVGKDKEGNEEWESLENVLSTNLEDLGVTGEEGDADDQVYVELSDSTTITKSGSRYDIGLKVADKTRYVDLKSYTKIIIRVQDDDEYEYVELSASDFTKSLADDVTLSDMVAIVSNDADSVSKENLVVLYATTEDDIYFKGVQSSDAIRIVSGWMIDQDAEGEWRVYYDLLNPFTGVRETDVASANSEEKSKNVDPGLDEQTFVKLSDGFVDDDEDKLNFKVHGLATEAKSYVLDQANLVWIAEVDEAEGTFVVVPYNADLTSAEKVEEFVESFDENDEAYNVTDIYGHAIDGNFVAFDKNTAVSVISYAAYNNDMWKYGSFGASSMSALVNPAKELLCYNNKALTGKDNDQETTRYSEFVKAYISVDHDVDDDEEPLVEYIIVVANGQEGTVLYNKEPAAE